MPFVLGGSGGHMTLAACNAQPAARVDNMRAAAIASVHIRERVSGVTDGNAFDTGCCSSCALSISETRLAMLQCAVPFRCSRGHGFLMAISLSRAPGRKGRELGNEGLFCGAGGGEASKTGD